MPFLLPSGSNQHEPLPSLPTTPTQMEEEDLGNASWLDAHEEHHHTESLMPRKNKGKGKAREIVGQEEEDEESSGSGSTGLNPVVEEAANGALEYPPTNGEDEESKRVAENLRRWETAERLKRRAARESTSSLGSSSIIGDVSRRASLLWRQGRRSSRATNGGGSGTHKALNMRSSEDTMPLDAMDRSPRTASSDTAFSPIQRSLSPADNPFEPPDTATPLNTNWSTTAAVMTPSSPPDNTSPFADSASVPSKPTLEASASFTHEPPPAPMPLGLPPPKTPPPRIPSPGEINEDGRGHHPTASGKEHRWWTEWLCGCREGEDRGGDDQAGRTNPFE